MGLEPTSQLLYPCGRAPLPIVKETEWVSEAVWMGLEKRKSLAPTLI